MEARTREVRRGVLCACAELAGTHDALGKPVAIVGLWMRSVPAHRRQHRWALVRQLRGELWRLARPRRVRLAALGAVLAGAGYASAAWQHDGQPSTLVALLAAVGVLGVGLVFAACCVQASAQLRRIAVLSHGVCACCLGKLSRQSCSSLATCDHCGAAWEGEAVFEVA